MFRTRSLFSLCALSVLALLIFLNTNIQLGLNIPTTTDSNPSNSLGAIEHKPEIQNVLLLSSWAEHLPWSKKLFRGVEEALKEQTNGKGNLFVEYLDYSRLGKPNPDEVLAKFLHQKYSQLHLDGVIVDSMEAVEFILEQGDKTFGDLPYVFYAGKPINSITFSAYAIINLAPVIDKTVLLALQQNPDVERILLVGDSSPQLEDMLKAAYQAIRVHKPDVEVMVKTDFTIDEIEREVSLLPERSLVLFTVVFRDRSGQSLRPIDVLERLVNSASVPIYVFYDPLIGNGVINSLTSSMII